MTASPAAKFDDAEHIISQARLDVHYVPGEHDIIDPEIKLYKERYGRGTKGSGYYSFDANGVHFLGLVNVANLKGGGMGSLGDEQLEWIEDDLKGRSAQGCSTLFTESHGKDGFETAERCGVAVLGDRIGLVDPQNIVGEAAHSREDAEIFSNARRVFT